MPFMWIDKRTLSLIDEFRGWLNDLGSGLIDYNQKMTMAAMQIADMNV